MLAVYARKPFGQVLDMGEQRSGVPSSALYALTVQRVRVLRRLLAVAVLVVTSGLAATACTQAGEAPMPAGASSSDAQLLEGRGIYIARCQRCHGPKGDGGAGSALAGRMVTKYPDPAVQAAIVANGKGGMPAWRNVLSPEEIDAVVRYTREVL
jgi:mono/diheme cytochrome c family protein